MKLGWFFNWGHGSSYPNQVEIEDCADRYADQQQMLTVGKPDNTEGYDLDPLKTQYLADDEEEAAYAELEALVTGTYPSTDSVLASYLLIPMYAERLPGAFYQIANEPDWAPYFTPEDYAIHFALFSSRIRKYDPTARIVLGGIAWARYNHPLKWRTKEFTDPNSMPEPMKTAIGNDPSARDMLESNAWVFMWIHAYRARYGTAPPVDVWAIHPYSWLAGDQAGQGNSDPALAVADTQASVESFREFLNSSYVQAIDKPLWLTEFSPGQNKTCVDFTDCNAKSANVIAYQDSLLPWLATSKLTQKWFWFVLQPTPSTAELSSSFMFTDDAGRLNDVSANYQRLAQELGDKQPPSIEHAALAGLSSKAKPQLAISATDAESGIARYAYRYLNSSGEATADWQSKDTFENAFTAELTLPAQSSVIEVRVQDHAGNEATCRISLENPP